MFCVYIDRTSHDGFGWALYTAHRDIVAFHPILLYSIWLACGRNMMCRYFLERCMHQFGYVQIILRSPFESTHDNTVPTHLDDILADYKSHLVPKEYRKMSATSQWSFVDCYMNQLYIVSRRFMTSDTHEYPYRSAHEVILENEQVMDDHAIDVFLIC